MKQCNSHFSSSFFRFFSPRFGNKKGGRACAWSDVMCDLLNELLRQLSSHTNSRDVRPFLLFAAKGVNINTAQA